MDKNKRNFPRSAINIALSIGIDGKEIPSEALDLTVNGLAIKTDFMTANIGGGKIYFGKLPKPTHKHMFISEELFYLRNEILRESVEECGEPKNLAEH